MKSFLNFTLAVVVGTALWAGSVRSEPSNDRGGAQVSSISLSAKSNYDEVENAVASAQEKYAEASDEVRHDLLDRAMKALSDGRISAHVDDAAFDVERATAAREQNGTQELLSIPLRGEELVEPSNLTIAFDESKAIETSIEVQYRGDSTAEEGRVTTWTDGKLTLDKMVNSAGENWEPGTAAPSTSDTEQITLAWSFSKFLDCLNAQGVSGWVVTAVSIGCAAACALTAGAGCLACIAAAGSITSGVIGACVYIASR